jgi:hypothetical protein
MTTKNNFEELEKFKFTFETEDAYYAAQRTGYIDDFDIVRMTVRRSDGSTYDFPLKSRESFEEALKNYSTSVINVYAAIHYYDVQDYD